MDASRRREEIKRTIEGATGPVSASSLARQLKVSRQIIVGDVALLRAQGCGIIATARGYVAESARAGRYTAKLASRHSNRDTVRELYAIVDMGGEVLDVVVDHELYGQLAGQLNLSSRREVDTFAAQARETGARLLSELTGGVHLHTVSCPDEATFRAIKKELERLGFLYPETDGGEA